MSKTINIQGTIIEFPESGTSPDWAEAVDQFAEAVETALAGVVGPYDVSPQVMTINGPTYNPTASSIDIPNLAFSTIAVRAAKIEIAVYRETTTSEVSENNTILIVYNDSNTPGTKWELSRETVGDASIDFTITDTGEVQFTTTSIGGINHIGVISYSAKALLNS